MNNKPKRMASTTLRDGVQAFDATQVSVEDRVEIAKMEEAMGFYSTEAGFPGERGAIGERVIEEVSRNTHTMIVAAMSGWDITSIDVAMDALNRGGAFNDRRGQLNVLLRPSWKLRHYGAPEPISRDDYLDGAVSAAKYAVNKFAAMKDRNGRIVPPRIMFYLEQAMTMFAQNFSPKEAEYFAKFYGRGGEKVYANTISSEPAFLLQLALAVTRSTFEEAHRLGIDPMGMDVILSPCDTDGVALLDDYGRMIRFLSDEVRLKIRQDVSFSCHCHNDFGNAVASSVQGVCAGANQVEVTACGFGEGPGNPHMAAVLAQLDRLTSNGRLELGVAADFDRSRVFEYESFFGSLVDGRMVHTLPVTGTKASYVSTVAGLHSATQQNADREAAELSARLGDRIEPIQTYRGLDARDFGNNGKKFVADGQGVGAIRDFLDELHLYVSPGVEQLLRADMRAEPRHSMALDSYLERVLMTGRVVDVIDAEEAGGRVRFILTSVEENMTAGGEHGGSGNQRVTLVGQKMSEGPLPEEFTITGESSKGAIAAAVHALRKVTGIDFDVEKYREAAIENGNGGDSDGSEAPTVAYMLLRINGQGPEGNETIMRAGLGKDRDSTVAKVRAIFEALNRIEWQKDAKKKSCPPRIS